MDLPQELAGKAGTFEVRIPARQSGKAFELSQTLVRTRQFFVPVRAEGHRIVDNGGDAVGEFASPAMAQRVAFLVNQDAGLS